MYRSIWFLFLAIGFYLITLLLGAIDTWAVGAAVPGTELYCYGSIAGNVPLSRVPLCLAVWFVEAKSWSFYARDLLLNLPEAGFYVHKLLRTADVALFAVGLAAAALAMAWLWANIMTHAVLLAVAATYTLLQGLAVTLGGRRPGWPA